nr:uncharacterized protein LOC127307175 isoform X2 [Lolium perenne]
MPRYILHIQGGQCGNQIAAMSSIHLPACAKGRHGRVLHDLGATIPPRSDHTAAGSAPPQQGHCRMRSSSTRTPPDASSSAATVLVSISTWLAPPARTAASAGSIPGPEPQVPGRQFYRLPHSRLHELEQGKQYVQVKIRWYSARPTTTSFSPRFQAQADNPSVSAPGMTYVRPLHLCVHNICKCHI